MAKKGLEGEYKQLIFDVIEKGESVEGLKARDDMGKVTVNTYTHMCIHTPTKFLTCLLLAVSVQGLL